MYPIIQSFIQEAITQFEFIPAQRKEALAKIAQYCLAQEKSTQQAALVYICTHNSRRSHFGQVWAQVAAAYYGFTHVQMYSGGTEATAFNSNAIQALRTMGFVITSNEELVNPHYEVSFSEETNSVSCFSKRYDDLSNPQTNFCAVMTCNDADEKCPYIVGASLRVATPYDDPKAFDGKAEQDAKYLERSKQLAIECLYLFSTIVK